MKRLLSIFATCLLLILNYGCSDDSITDNTQLTISVYPEIVPYNGEAVINWNVSGVLASYVKTDVTGDSRFSTNYSIPVDNVREDLVYTIMVYDSEDKLIESKVVIIRTGGWNSSVFGRLVHGMFVYKKISKNFKLNDYTWSEPIDDKMYELYNAEYDFQDDDFVYIHPKPVSGVSDFKQEFSLDEDSDTLFLGNTPHKIFKLDKDSLIIEIEGEFWEDKDKDGTIDEISQAFFRFFFLRNE